MDAGKGQWGEKAPSLRVNRACHTVTRPCGCCKTIITEMHAHLLPLHGTELLPRQSGVVCSATTRRDAAGNGTIHQCCRRGRGRGSLFRGAECHSDDIMVMDAARPSLDMPPCDHRHAGLSTLDKATPAARRTRRCRPPSASRCGRPRGCPAGCAGPASVPRCRRRCPPSEAPRSDSSPAEPTIRRAARPPTRLRRRRLLAAVRCWSDRTEHGQRAECTGSVPQQCCTEAPHAPSTSATVSQAWSLTAVTHLTLLSGFMPKCCQSSAQQAARWGMHGTWVILLRIDAAAAEQGVQAVQRAADRRS